MPTLLEILDKTREFFAKKGLENPRLEAELVLAGTLGFGRLDLYLKFERPMTDAELDTLRGRVRRRGDREPLQYVLGNAPFRSLSLLCDRRALIPRPETEELVGHVLGRLPKGRALRLADLGCGTGAIALSLAREWPSAEVTACDFSSEALDLARENAVRCGLSDRVEFVRSDWTEGLSGTFDAIVSNPPYLTDSELEVALPEVREHEPHSALVAPEEGCADLEKILLQSFGRLAPEGFVALETGIAQHGRLAEFAAATGYARSESLRDFGDFDRFFFAFV